jgi:pimeloyl-ACP methyl ester carboxylesterase
MKRDSYFFANFFLGILAICSFFQSIIFFLLGLQMGTLPSFFNWVLVVSGVQIVASIFVLKYYRYKKYELVFVAGVIVTIASFCQSIIIYMIRLLQTLYIPSLIFFAAAGVFYGIGLIFSNAGERIWLKAAGIVLLVTCLIYLSVIFWITISAEIRYSPVVVMISQWTSLLHAFVPVMLIMNFLNELKISKVEDIESRGTSFSESLMALVVILGLILPFVFGARIAGESLTKNQVNSISIMLAQTFESRSYVNGRGDTMSYRLLKPLAYDSTKKYPLMVCLHGGAGWGTDNMKQLHGSIEAQILSSPENRKKYPAFLFVPQCPPGTGWGGRMLAGLKPLDSLVFEIIDSLENEFNIDTGRRYVMGHSLGGYGAWHFIATRPEMFAAGVPMAGEGDPTLARSIVDVPVWAFHGRLDRNVPVSGSRNIIEAAREFGGNPRYTEYPYIGHGIWDEIKGTPELMDWVFAQKRE